MGQICLIFGVFSKSAFFVPVLKPPHIYLIGSVKQNELKDTQQNQIVESPEKLEAKQTE